MSHVTGPLLVAERIEHVGYGELVEVVSPAGDIRRGQVLSIDSDRVVVQVLEGTRGLDRPTTTVLSRGRGTRTGVGRDLVGRVLDGSGRPIDDGPPVAPDAYRDVNGRPINPFARARPSEFIETGISAIDGLNTLVRGQKLPIFSGFGLPAPELAAQIAAQARVSGEQGDITSYCESPARNRLCPRGDPRAPRLPRVHVHGPRVAVRTRRPHSRSPWFRDAARDPLNAGRRHHAPDP